MTTYEFMIACRSLLLSDPVLRTQTFGVFYSQAPADTQFPYITGALQDGRPEKTMQTIIGRHMLWQISGWATDKDGKEAMYYLDAIDKHVMPLFDDETSIKMFGHDCKGLNAYLARYGWQVESTREKNEIPPSSQMIGNVQRWRYGRLYEIYLQPLEG